LHVRWGLAGVYVVKLFLKKEPEHNGRLFHTSRSRTPLPWRAESLAGAREQWRAWTGRAAPLEWRKVWVNGRLVYTREGKEPEVGKRRVGEAEGGRGRGT
jgi:hypothetical protein